MLFVVSVFLYDECCGAYLIFTLFKRVLIPPWYAYS